VIWKCHENLIFSPDARKRTEALDENKPYPFKNLKALAISPNEDAIAYITMKRSWGVLQKELRISKMTFDSAGKVSFTTPVKVSLEYPFDIGSSLSMICENGEAHCFVAHRNGPVEKFIFPEHSF
jgi:hypothetical protein